MKKVCIFHTIIKYEDDFSFSVASLSCHLFSSKKPLKYWNLCPSLGSCSDGWTAFKQNCYKVSTESKPWKVAQQNCGLFSSGAHLVDIRNNEEHEFLSFYLQSLDQIMLWTGLNDIKVSMVYLSWNDQSSFSMHLRSCI